MSTLTRCTPTPRRRITPPSQAAMATMIVMATFVVFGVAHLRLRFSLSDLAQETQRLQERRLELNSEINRLRGDVATARRGDRLMDHARTELGMVQLPPQNYERITLSPQNQRRYGDMALAQVRTLRGDGGMGEERRPWSSIVERFSLAAEAVAGEPSYDASLSMAEDRSEHEMSGGPDTRK